MRDINFFIFLLLLFIFFYFIEIHFVNDIGDINNLESESRFVCQHEHTGL